MHLLSSFSCLCSGLEAVTSCWFAFGLFPSPLSKASPCTGYVLSFTSVTDCCVTRLLLAVGGDPSLAFAIFFLISELLFPTYGGILCLLPAQTSIPAMLATDRYDMYSNYCFPVVFRCCCIYLSYFFGNGQGIKR